MLTEFWSEHLEVRDHLQGISVDRIFFVVYFYDAVDVSGCIVSNGNVTGKLCIGTDFEGSGRGLIEIIRNLPVGSDENHDKLNKASLEHYC
jgi:hypothetical protein